MWSYCTITEVSRHNFFILLTRELLLLLSSSSMAVRNGSSCVATSEKRESILLVYFVWPRHRSPREWMRNVGEKFDCSHHFWADVVKTYVVVGAAVLTLQNVQAVAHANVVLKFTSSISYFNHAYSQSGRCFLLSVPCGSSGK